MIVKALRSRKSGRIAAAMLASLALLCFWGCDGAIAERPDDTSRPEATKSSAAETPAPETPKNGGTLKLSVGPYDTVDPLRTSNEDVRLYMCAFVCENLIDLGPNMEPVPGILGSWVCDGSYKVWEFEVTRGVTFHSGAEVKAADVKNLIDTIVGFGGNYAENVKNVAGCFAKDQYTLQILLGEPDALFVNKLVIPLVGWRTFTSDNPSVMDGTGIFKTTEFNGENFLLEKNTLYRDKSKLSYYNTVDITVFGSENEKVLSDFDICVVQGPEVGSDLLHGDSRVYRFRGTGYDYIALNCGKYYALASESASGTAGENYVMLDNPFSDKRMRQVVNLVTSREKALRAAASGHGVISLLPLYSGTVYRKQLSDDYETNTEKAKSLLREMGFVQKEDGWFSGEEELVVRGISPKYNYRMMTAMRTAAEGLRSIGVKVEIAELPDSEYLRRLENREYMMAAMETELGVWQDCSEVFGTDGSLNYSFYSDTRVDGYLEQTGLHSDPAVVAAAYAKIEEILLEDCPIVGLFIPDNAIVVSGRVKGVKVEDLRPWAPLAGVAGWWVE